MLCAYVSPSRWSERSGGKRRLDGGEVQLEGLAQLFEALQKRVKS